MNNISALHPDLQNKIAKLIALCNTNGITIGISECLRTVDEQNALYAKGRTTSGSIVTNCKGTDYKSMHQWGVAFDFYLNMDVDGDGDIDGNDKWNTSTGLFEKVGSLGKSIGLMWGGDFKSFKDLCHFQLADWGSTTSTLRAQYGTPDRFMSTWAKSTAVVPTQPELPKQTVTPASKSSPESATSKSSSYNRSYKTTANLNLRLGAGTNKGVITVIPKGSTVRCYGYHTNNWLFVSYGKYTGYVSKSYLK